MALRHCESCRTAIPPDAPGGLCPRCLVRLGLGEDDSAAQAAQIDVAGQTVGAYRLTSLIGQGGMGSVWLAHRSDERFEGRAAVKLLNSNLGRAGEARFRREGTILARLTHPSIARLLDAGVSAGGQPYLVLEHVEGEHIDRYCDDRRLGIEERIRLFGGVLGAVAHAHASLVVHRDIKPSNVLVDTNGEVKLLDFGIAKLLADETDAAAATRITREGGRALTPAYAAPEQVTGGPVTTATDVYSLGALLYELLSGQHPIASGSESPAELMNAIVDAEPPRLSDAVVLSKALSREVLDANAANRAATPDKLRRVLRGDVDTIVAKALKKRPTERYATVTALADDLQRYLDRRPISARPDTLAYRGVKFVLRHRAPVVLAAFAIAALVAGLMGTVSQARRAEAQRARAEEAARSASEQRDFALRELSRAEAINDLNAFLLSDAAPSGKPFVAGELLARAEQIVDRQHADTPENRIEMLVAIGQQYESLDEEGSARLLLSKAYDLSRNVADRAVRAKAAWALAGAIAPAGEFARAERLIQDALNELGDVPEHAIHRVFALLRGSYVARESGDSELAIERVQTAQRILQESGQGSALMELRVSMNLAESYRMAGRNRDAAKAFEEAFARLSSLGRENTERAGTLLNNWGLAVQILGQPLEAERLFRRAVTISSADGTDRHVSPMLLNNLARALLDLNRLSEAELYAVRAYTTAQRAHDELVVNQVLSVRFGIDVEQREFAQAAEVLAELEPRWKRTMPPGHIAFAVLPLYKADLAAERGEGSAAIAGADQGIALAEANSQGLDYLPTLLLRRAKINLTFRRFDDARADAEKALAMEIKAGVPGALSSRVGRAHLMLGRALSGQGNVVHARSALTSALTHLEPTLGADHPSVVLARQLAANGSTSR